MRASRRLAALSSAALALSSSLLLPLAPSAAVAQQATVNNKCPEANPCASEYSNCGSTSAFCLGGCNPLLSYAPDACAANPICVSQNISLANTAVYNTSIITNLTDYTGNANKAHFTLDSGNPQPGGQGVLLTLTEKGGGTRLSTTRYVHYGKITVMMRHASKAGVVAAAIMMSDIKGEHEIDFEFTTASAQDVETNFYKLGIADYTNGEKPSVPSGFSSSDWHAYTINWQQDQLQWIVDGQVLRTVQASDTDKYPRSPSRVQLSIWPAGLSTMPSGTVQWAGGMIDWSDRDYVKNGYFSNEILWLNVECADAGANGNATSYSYGDTNDTTTGEPIVTASTRSSSLTGAAVPAAVVFERAQLFVTMGLVGLVGYFAGL